MRRENELFFACSEFSHIFQTSDGISSCARICKFNVFCEIIYELIAPTFMSIDRTTDKYHKITLLSIRFIYSPKFCFSKFKKHSFVFCVMFSATLQTF